MAKKDDVDLDSMDLDDLDFDIPEWNADEEVDASSRSPIERTVKGATKGLKQELASPQALRSALSMALPEGYALAGDTIENVATDARSLYDKITGDSPEIVRGSKKFGQKAMNLVGNKVLPKKVAARLNAALEEDEAYEVKSDAQYKREQEESDLAALAEIFKAKAGADEERANKESVEGLERKAVDQARFKTNIQVLTAINRSMARLVGYQDKVTARYQQKMLELNYRQYATTKQLTDLMATSTAQQTAILETIRHNTALPEAVKIRGSEMFGQLAKQRLMGTGLNTISNWSQNYTKQVMDNVTGMVQGILDPIKDIQAMTEGMDIDKHELAGQALGSTIGQSVRDHASMYLSPYLAKNKYIAKGGEKLRSTFSGLPQRVNEFAQSETQGSGFKSVMTQMFKSFLPQFSLDSRPGNVSVDSLDEIDKFDKIARRSLIEIIPGYLSEIAHWTRAAVTGEKDAEKQIYNVVRGGFTGEKEQLKDVGRQIMTRSERDSLRTASDEFLKMIGGDVMSSKAQRALKRKLLDELANGRDLKPERLVDPSQYPGEDVEVVDEIVSLIADSFGLDYEGKPSDTTTEGLTKFNNIRDHFLRMSSMIPASGDRIRILSDVLGKDSLRKLGYIERQGREDRINYDKIWSSVLDEDDESGEDRASQGGPDGNHRSGQRDDRVSGNDKVRGDLTRRANRADHLSGHRKGGTARVVGLERYLGDKSTLITMIRESRDFHSETVELLKQLTNCGCGGSKEASSLYTSASDRFRSLKAGLPDRYKRVRDGAESRLQQAQDWGNRTYEDMVPKFESFKAEAKDMWIQGEDHPRLQEWKLKAGHYRDKATGDVIKKWEDIQSDVVDLKGKTVARYDELMDSAVLADYKGKVLKRASDLMGKFKGSKAGAMTNSAALLVQEKSSIISKEAQKQTRRFKPRVKRLMRRFMGDKAGADVSDTLTGEPGEDMVTLMMRSVQLQYETLKQVTPEKIRKGSFQDIFSRRKELMQQGKDKIKGKFDDAQGLFSKGGLLAGLMSKLGMGGDEEGGSAGGIMDTIGDLFGGGDSEGRGSRKDRRRAKRTGKLGRLTNMGGRALDKLGRFGKAVKLGAKGTGLMGRLGWGATKLVGKGGWGLLKGAKSVLTNPLTRMIGGTALRMAGGALLGAAGLVSAPVLAVAGIVGAGIAVGAYIYGATRDKLPPLTRLRMAQYGVKNKPDSDEVKALVELEKLIAKHTSVDSDGKAKIDTQSVPPEAIAKIFQVDLDVEPGENELMQRVFKYVRERFAAVYLTHISNYYTLTKSMDLGQIDAKLTGKAALDFVSKVSMKDRSEVFNAMIGPFEDEDLDMDHGDVEDTLEEVKEDIADFIKKDAFKDKGSAVEQNANAMKAGAAAAGAVGAVATTRGAAPANISSRAVGAPPSGGTAALNAGSKAEAASLLKDAATANVATAGTMMAVAAMVMSTGKSVNMEDGSPVRFRTYGLTELSEVKAAMLMTLENALWAQVVYDKDKKASFKDAAMAYEVAEKIFSPLSETVQDMYVWFHRRFAPTFLAFCTAVRMRANIDAKDAGERLKPHELLAVLKETAVARDNAGISVWDIEASPWIWYVLNSDPSSVEDSLYNLSLKIKDPALSESKTPNKGRVLDKNGKPINEDPTQTNRPANADGSQGPNSGANGSQNVGGGEEGILSSFWSGVKSVFGGDKKAPQQGSVNNQGQSVAAGASEMASGTPISHPGGGAGGNINDIPEPKGDGWDSNRETLMAAANMVGVDPSLAASIAGVESNFRPNALPYKNPRNPSAGVLSSAASYYQVIKGTWKYLMGKYAAKYGIHPDTTQHDPRANALLGLEYIRENIGTIKGAMKRGVVDTDVYLAHFLGPGGAKRFLSAPPTDAAINHVGADQAKSNPAIFYDRNGRPRSVAAVYNDFDEKLKKHRKGDASQVAQMLKTGSATQQVAETGSDQGNAVESEVSGFAVAADDTMPSMVKPAGGAASTTNTVAEASSNSDTSNLTERANARQTQNSTAGLQMAARTAEVQSSTKSKAATNTYGGLDANLGKLLSVNESQLEQLIALVSLVKGGGMSMPSGKNGTAELIAQGKTTTQNPVINTPKAAAKGPVSVGRV